MKVLVINDAVLQALGAYRGGRMLFLGFGTGLASALVSERVAVPLELGELPYGHGTLMDSVGRQGLQRLGLARWQVVLEVAPALKRAFMADEVVMAEATPPESRRCPRIYGAGAKTTQSRAAIGCGGSPSEPLDRQSSGFWRVVR